MRTKKKMDSYVKENLSRYENESFLERLKSNVSEETAEKRSRKIRHIVFSAVGAALVVAVCVGVLLWAPWKKAESTTLEEEPSIETVEEETPSDKGKEAETPLEAEKEEGAEERHYLFEDQTSEEITLEELNAQLKYIHFSADGLKHIKMAVNTQYNEILYYSLQYNIEDLDEIKIVLVTNDQYEYEFSKETPYNVKADVLGCEINYSETYTEEDGLYIFKARGEMLSEDVMLYIMYSGMWFEETSNFIPLLRSILE